MRVKNIQNTSSLRCKCTNWLDHWMRFTNKRIVPQCSAYNCASKSILGGHVIKCASTDKNWYIIPLCVKHNSSQLTDCYQLKKNIQFVPANVSKTCKK